MTIAKLLADCFLHLGQEALYQSKYKRQPYLIQILSKRPDKFHEIGDGQFVGEMLFLEVSVFDILQPVVGDIFIINDHKYKIYSPPLRDNSGMIWEIQAIAMEK